MIEVDQEASAAVGTRPAPGQAAIRTWLPSSRRGTAATATKTSGDSISRFHGDGVRYKAKLIGVDPVPDAEGDKMCLDSMMKLKGLEAAARSQGKHKQRVWLKVSTSGLKIVDERSGVVQHEHEGSRISSLTKDESDPRALAYIYKERDAYSLFYIKMANLADPVLDDIKEVCQSVDLETAQEPAEEPAQNGSLLLLDDTSASLPKVPGDLDLFSPVPSRAEQTKQVSSADELMDIFSIQLEEPPAMSQDSPSSQPGFPQPSCTSQLGCSYPMQPAGAPPYSPPTIMPWGQQPPWPRQPGGVAAWPAAGGAAPPAGGWFPPHNTNFVPGLVPGRSAAGFPPAAHPVPLNTMYAPSAGAGPLQPASPTAAVRPSLG